MRGESRMVEIFNVIPQIQHGVGQTFLELSPSPTSPIVHLMITAEMSSKKRKKKKKGRKTFVADSVKRHASSPPEARFSSQATTRRHASSETRVRLWNTIYRRKARPSEICRQRFLHGSGTEDRQEQTLAENALWVVFLR